MYAAYILVRSDGNFFLRDDVAGIDLMLQEKCGDTRFCFAVDYRKINALTG